MIDYLSNKSDDFIRFVLGIIVTVFILTEAAGIILLFFPHPPQNWVYTPVSIFLLLLASIFFKYGLIRVQEEEIIIIERFGAFYKIVGSSLRWRFPMPYVDQIRIWQGIWEQAEELFPNNPSIDFKEGGSAQLIDVQIYTETNKEEYDGNDPSDDIPDHLSDIEANVYRSAYRIDNWKRAARERGEMTLRNILNKLTVEEALSLNYDDVKVEPESSFLRKLLEKRKRKMEDKGKDFKPLEIGWKEIIETVSPDLIADLKKWGRKLTKITISDFNLSDKVLEIRRKVFEAERKIEMAKREEKEAKYKAKAKARLISEQYAGIKKILVEYGATKKEARRAAGDLIEISESKDIGQLHKFIGDLDLDDLGEAAENIAKVVF